MAGKAADTGIICLEYLKFYPSLPTRRIAAMINADLGPSYEIERVRKTLRYYRGASGDKARADIRPENFCPRIETPPTEAKTLEPYNLAVADFPILIGADAHFPYHDEDCIDIFFDRAAKIGAKTIILLGDWMDMYQASSFVKDPRARRIPEEIEQMRDFLAGVRRAFPNTRIVYKIGNHEDRLETYVKINAPALYGLPDVHLASLLKLSNVGIECVPSRQLIRAGKPYILHGHELGHSVFSPVNPARGLYLKAKKSAICGHYHQTSEHAEKNLEDKVESCWTVGCLCDMKPEYMPVNKWNHGLAELYHEDGMYAVKNRKIINYRLV